MLNIIFLTLLVSIFIMVWASLRIIYKDARRLEFRMHGYVFNVANEKLPSGEQKEIRQKRYSSTLIPLSIIRRVERRLAQADVSLYGNEFLYIVAGLFIAACLLSLILSRSILFSFVAAILTSALPFLFLRHKAQTRSKRFEGQLSDALTLISNSLRVGYSFSTAIDLVTKELRPPISAEFTRFVRDLKLGADFDEALAAMGNRLQSNDFNLFLTAVQIQRQVGGNLTEVLDKLAATIRERDRVRGEIKTLTAQGKLSGLIIGILPIVVGFIIFIINPSYIIVMFQSLLGISILGITVMLEIFGALLIRQIINIEG